MFLFCPEVFLLVSLTFLFLYFSKRLLVKCTICLPVVSFCANSWKSTSVSVSKNPRRWPIQYLNFSGTWRSPINFNLLRVLLNSSFWVFSGVGTCWNPIRCAVCFWRLSTLIKKFRDRTLNYINLKRLQIISPSHDTSTLPSFTLFSEYHTDLKSASKCNFLQFLTNNLAFCFTILMKLTNTQQNYIQIARTKFYLNRTRNARSPSTNFFTPFSKARLSVADFHKTHLLSSITWIILRCLSQCCQEIYKLASYIRLFLQYSMTATVPIFTKLMIAWQHL